VTGVGLIVSRFIGLDFKVGCFVGLIGVLFCSVLGGMKSGHVDAGRPVHHS
jgi:cation/acetate symporter